MRYLLVIVCLVPVGLAFGQEPAAEPGPAPRVTIELATVGADEAGDFLMREVEAFQAAHPDIKVVCHAVQEPARHRAPLHTLGHIGQNVIGVSSEAGTEVYQLVARDLLVPVEEFLPDPDFPPDLFYENLWDAVTYQGQRWAVPYLCDSLALICDWRVFEQEGIERPPETWAELSDYVKRFTKDTDGDGELDQLGLNIETEYRHYGYPALLWRTMVLQKGAGFIRDGRYDLSDPALRESYDYLAELLASEGVAHDDRGFGATVADPKVRCAMHIQPSYRVKNMQGMQYLRMAPLPTFGKKVCADDKRYYLAVRRSTPEKEAASWAFIKWICRKDVSVERTRPSRLTFPCRKDMVERPDVLSQFEAFAQDSEYLLLGKAWPVQANFLEADTPAANDRFNEILNLLFSGALTFDEAMARASRECNGLIRAGSAIGPQPYALYR